MPSPRPPPGLASTPIGPRAPDGGRPEDPLRPSEAIARALMENVRDQLVVLEPVRGAAGAVTDWRYVDANDGALALLGVGREVFGRTMRQVLGDEVTSRRLPDLLRVLETGERHRYEVTWAGRTLLVTLFRVSADLVASASVDLTEARAAERAVRQSEERFRRLVEVSSQVVWTAEVGREAVEETRPGTGWLDAIHPDDRERVRGAWRRAVEASAPYRVEFRQLDAAGGCRHMECRAVPIFGDGGAVREWVGMNVDITERTVAAAELQAVNERLRDTDRRKDEFLAMLSHELRNPLAPIRNAVAILDRASPGSEPADRARAVIGRQVDHLARLVDDLLDVTRIARGKVELRRERVDLVTLLQRAAEDHRPLLTQRGLRLAVEVPPDAAWVHGDATRLAQVFGNLLQNAAKFTDRGGDVRVALRVAGREAEARVADTGIGLDPAMVERIFEPFVQSDRSLARTRGGLGLGLALARRIAELHGGTVHAESAGPGRGTEVVVRLPLDGGAHQAGGPGSLPARAARRRLLVVDDHRDAALSLAEVLRLMGHEVEVAHDGPAALAAVAASPPDVVLCDIGLPGMSGYDVARALRARPPAGGVRLVAVSGYARPEDVERAREAGFDAHLAKPPRLEELEAILASGPGEGGG